MGKARKKNAEALARHAEAAAEAVEDLAIERKQYARSLRFARSLTILFVSIAAGSIMKVRSQTRQIAALETELEDARARAEEANTAVAQQQEAVAAAADGDGNAVAAAHAASAVGGGGGGGGALAAAGGAIRRPPNATELLLMGGIFLEPHISEILMEEPVQAELDFDNETWATERWVAGAAIDMISVPVPASERAAGVLSAATRATVVDYVRTLGVAVLPSLLDPDACRALAAWVKSALVDPDRNTNGLGGIAEAEFRFDYPVEAEAAPVQAVMGEALRFYGGALEALVGANATLEELSTITSVPGATQQGKHPDLGMDAPAHLHAVQLLVTSFVALDDVGTDQAALDLWPATHTHCHFLYNAEKEMLVSAPAVRLAVPAGSVVLMDSRTYHRGTANTSPRDRPVMYFSFMSADPARDRPHGPTFTMLPRYRGRVTLAQARAGEYPEGLTKADDRNPLVKAGSVLSMTRAERVRMAYNAAHGGAAGVKYGKDDRRPGKAMGRDEPVYTVKGHQTEAEALASDALILNDGIKRANDGGGGGAAAAAAAAAAQEKTAGAGGEDEFL